MTFEQTVNGLLPTLLLPPDQRPPNLGLSPAGHYLLHAEVERRCLAELSRRNAPDEVAAGAAADHVLCLLPDLAAKYDPAVGSLAAYVDGAIRKVCPRYAHRYHREHGGTGGRPLDARPSGGPTPVELAIVGEAVTTMRRAADGLRPRDRRVLQFVYPEAFDRPRPKRTSRRSRPCVRICRAKARLHAALLAAAPGRPWDAVLALLLPRGR